jgi:hypothetical protein
MEQHESVTESRFRRDRANGYAVHPITKGDLICGVENLLAPSFFRRFLTRHGRYSVAGGRSRTAE